MSYYYKFVSHGENPEKFDWPLRKDLVPFARKYPEGFILEQNYAMCVERDPKYWTQLTNVDLVIELHRKTPVFWSLSYLSPPSWRRHPQEVPL